MFVSTDRASDQELEQLLCTHVNAEAWVNNIWSSEEHAFVEVYIGTYCPDCKKWIETTPPSEPDPSIIADTGDNNGN